MNESDGRGGDVHTETLLRERCEHEMGGVTPDVSSLVGAGLATGRRLRRRRQLATGAVAAVAVVAATAIGVTAVDRGLFDSDSGPAGPVRVEQLEPATNRGMAAAVIAHLPDGYEDVGTTNTEPATTNAVIGFAGGEEAVYLMVQTVSDTSTWASLETEECAVDGITCDFFTAEGGAPAASLIGTVSGVQFSGVAVNRGGEVVFASLLAPGKGAELPLTTDELVAIAADPVVGLETSHEMNVIGSDIEPWRHDYPLADLTTSMTTGGSTGADPGDN